MASIVPRRLLKKLTYFRGHVGPFAANAAAIGLTEEDVAEFEALVIAAEAAQMAQLRAQATARGKTIHYNETMDALSKLGATLIMKVRAKAVASDDPSVYVKATIPPPAQRSPMGPPGTPTKFTSSVDGIGQVTIKWECDNPKGSTGTTYQVRRRLALDQPFEFIGITGVKQFVDTTVPKGVTSLTYDIRAIRSTAFGEAAQFNVYFGSNGMKMTGAFMPNLRPRQLAA